MKRRSIARDSQPTHTLSVMSPLLRSSHGSAPSSSGDGPGRPGSGASDRAGAVDQTELLGSPRRRGVSLQNTLHNFRE